MPKLSKRLEEIRNKVILMLFNKQYSAKEIGNIFDLTTSQIYNIIKENKERK